MPTPPSNTQHEAWSSLPKLPVLGLVKKSWHLVTTHGTLWRLMMIFSLMVLVPLIFGTYAVHNMAGGGRLHGLLYLLVTLQILSSFSRLGADAGAFSIALPVLDIALGRDTHVRTFKDILSLAYLKPLFFTKRFLKIVLLIAVSMGIPLLIQPLINDGKTLSPPTKQSQKNISPPVTSSRVVSEKELNAEGQIVRHRIKTVHHQQNISPPVTSSRVVSEKELNAEGQIVRHRIKTVHHHTTVPRDSNTSITVHENTPASAHAVRQEAPKTPTQSHGSTWDDLSRRLITLIAMMWHVLLLYVFTRFLPLYGTLADERPRPLSRAWHLSRKSFWRLFSGMQVILLLGILGNLMLIVTLLFTPTLGGKLLITLPLAAWVGGLNIFLYVYYGLAYRFLEDTRGPLLDSASPASQGAIVKAEQVAPAPKQKTSQKGAQKTPQKSPSASARKTPSAKTKAKPRTPRKGAQKPPPQT